MADWETAAEIDMLRETVRQFVERSCKPLEAYVEEHDELPADKLPALLDAAISSGLYGYNMPVAFGGTGLPMIAQVAVTEEMGGTLMVLQEFLRLLGTLRAARPEQVPWLVEPVMRGEKRSAEALTEPDAGSDLGGLKTRAQRVAGGWRLNGSKQFISHADTADFVVVLAVTDPAADLKGRFTAFIVRRENPGFHVTRRFRKMGWRGYHLAAFSLEDCVVPDGDILGTVGGGFGTMIASINETRIIVGARCVGMTDDLLVRARDWVLERKTFGKRLADHQAIQFQLADIDVELEAARLLTHKAALLFDRNDPGLRIAAARAKLYASEMLGRAADSVLQIFGGAGYMCDLPIERIYRDARAFRIGEGTSEMQRIQIARHVLSSAR